MVFVGVAFLVYLSPYIIILVVFGIVGHYLYKMHRYRNVWEYRKYGKEKEKKNVTK